jgi:hypothetical protein
MLTQKKIYLRRLFADCIIEVPPTHGVETITTATDLFTAGFDPKFTKWGLGVPSSGTTVEQAAVYEDVNDGNFFSLFGSLHEDANQLLWTENQVVSLCRNYQWVLHTTKHGTFFLITKGGELANKDKSNVFVANVCFYKNGLGVALSKFLLRDVWNAFFRDRFVVPIVL